MKLYYRLLLRLTETMLNCQFTEVCEFHYWALSQGPRLVGPWVGLCPEPKSPIVSIIN
jgi:hypothetical protein